MEVGLSGVAKCHHYSSIAAGTQVNYYINFGYTTINQTPWATGIEEADDGYFNVPLTLTTPIVNPGVTLNEPAQYTVTLTAQLCDNMAWSVGTVEPGPGTAAIDFYNGIQFSSVNVPDGVTWTSESGIFLDQVPTGSDDPLVAATRLNQNHPNPFNPVTTISYYLAEPSRVNLGIFDVSGKLVRALERGMMAGEGKQEIIWNGLDDAGRDVASGVYFYRLRAGTFSETRKMVKLR